MPLKTLAALVVATILIQDPAADDRAERMKMAFQLLSDTDPELREVARRELLSLGRDVVPKLEELLKAKGALEIYRIVREIELGKSGPPSEIPGPMLSHEEFLRRIGRPDGTAPDAYVRARMADVYKHFKEKQFQRAFDVVNALLVLEPKSRYAADLQRMRRTCDNMVTQSSMVRSRVSGPHAAQAGSKVEFMLRMENQWKGGINIQFDKEVARPIVVVEITVERMDPNGSVTKATRVEDFPIEREIPIAMGAQWERPITLDTNAEFSDDQDYIRLYTVGAWMPVVKIDRGPQAEAQKRIFFEPVTVRLVPTKHLHLADDPLGKLGKAMDAGSVNEVFICALLLTEAQKTPGVELLVAALEKANANLKKARERRSPEEEGHLKAGMSVIANILTALTGEKLGIDPVQWRKYADGLRTK
ncbi:MAG TPA: hypothetical protein VFS19_03375 [Planctomycetota bacterium]|nr:hypothetical protein [Planctomycetota bacterium]